MCLLKSFFFFFSFFPTAADEATWRTQKKQHQENHIVVSSTKWWSNWLQIFQHDWKNPVAHRKSWPCFQLHKATGNPNTLRSEALRSHAEEVRGLAIQPHVLNFREVHQNLAQVLFQLRNALNSSSDVSIGYGGRMKLWGFGQEWWTQISTGQFQQMLILTLFSKWIKNWQTIKS